MKNIALNKLQNRWVKFMDQIVWTGKKKVRKGKKSVTSLWLIYRNVSSLIIVKLI